MSNDEDYKNDLIYKVELLKKALIAEKQKTQLLEQDNKLQKKLVNDLENEINRKDNEVVKITSEKNNLMFQLDFHRHGKITSGESIPIFETDSYNLDFEEIHQNIKNSKEEINKERNKTSQDEKELKSTTKLTNNEVSPIINNKTEPASVFNITPIKNSFSYFVNNIGNIFDKAPDKNEKCRKSSNLDIVDVLQDKETSQVNQNTNYELLLSNYKLQNNNLKSLLSESNLNIKNIKENYRDLINAQTEKIKNLEVELSNTKDELFKLTQSNSYIVNQKQSYEIKLNNSENLVKKLETDLTACKDTIKKFHTIIEEKDEVITYLKESLKKFESENSILNKKLTQLKNVFLEENIREKSFNSIEVTSMKKTKLTFGKSDDGYFVMVVDRYDGKLEYVFINEIIEFKPNNNDNSLILRYYVNGKIAILNLLMQDNISDAVKVYGFFKQKANEQV